MNCWDEPTNCRVCGKDIKEDYTAISIGFVLVPNRSFTPESIMPTIPDYLKIDGGYLIQRKICRNPQCYITTLNELGEPAKKDLAKNQTNATGPASRGAPGCALNEHFEVPAPDSTTKKER